MSANYITPYYCYSSRLISLPLCVFIQAIGQVALDALELLCSSLTINEHEEIEGEYSYSADTSLSLPLEARKRVSLVLSKEVMDGILELLHQRTEVTMAVSAAKLLRTFHIRAPKETEFALLECPAGVQRIVDVLRDPREVVRNLVVLALGSLTTVCVELCEAVAFQEGLEQLFNIMRLEGMLTGGEVIRDCLVVCMNVIKNSVVAQRLFCDGQCIHILHRLIDLRRLQEGKPSELSVSPLQEQIMVSGITLLRLVLSRSSGQIAAAENQGGLKHKQQSVACAADGLLSELLVHVAFSRADPYSFTPSSVRSIACEAVGDLMNNNYEIQYFMDQMLVMDLGKDSILLSSLLVERLLECAGNQSNNAIWGCLYSLYVGNELGATQALNHVLAPPPPPVGVDIDLELWEPPPAMGSIVLSALEALGNNSYIPNVVDKSIIACKVLSLLLQEGGDNAAEITLCLKVRSPDGEPLMSFMTRHAEVAYLKATHGKMVLCVEILKVLCHWLNGSSVAVDVLLHSPESLFLYELAAKAEFKGNNEGNVKDGTYSAKTEAHCIACLILGLCFLHSTPQDHEQDGKLVDHCSNSSISSVSRAIENKVGLRRVTSGIDMLKRHVEATKPPISKHNKTGSSGCLWTRGFAKLVTHTAETMRSSVIEYFHTEWKRDESDERVKMMENELKGLNTTILALEQQLENKNVQQELPPASAPAAIHSPPLTDADHENRTLVSRQSKNAEAILKEENTNLVAENENLKHELMLALNNNNKPTPPSPNTVQRESETVLALRKRISALELEIESQSKALVTTAASFQTQMTSAENDRAAALEEANQALTYQTATQVELSNTTNQLIRETERLEEARKEVDELKNKARDNIVKTVQEEHINDVSNERNNNDSFELLAIIAQLGVMVEELVRTLESIGDASAIEVVMNRVAAICIQRFGVFVSYL